MRRITPYLACALLAGLILAMPSQAAAKRYYIVRDQYGNLKWVDPTASVWYKLAHPIKFVTSLVPTINPPPHTNFYHPVTQTDMQAPATLAASANQAVDSAAQLVTDVTGSSQLGRFVDSVGTAAIPSATPAVTASSSAPSSQPPPSRTPH